MNRKRLKRYINKYGWNETAMNMFNRIIYRKTYNDKDDYNCPSLLDDWHIHYDKDYETWVEYGIFELKEDLSDKEITETLYEEFGIKIYSPYDCTGKVFTRYIEWHRNPNGLISVLHYKGLDV